MKLPCLLIGLVIFGFATLTECNAKGSLDPHKLISSRRKHWKNGASKPPNVTATGERMEKLNERASHAPTKLPCNLTYEVGPNGVILFQLDSPHRPCTYNFVGSKLDKCTVAMTCRGKLDFKPASGNNCVDEWLLLSDGTQGRMSGCGAISFKNVPKTPLVGSDLYVYYKGAPGSACITFCKEDMNPQFIAQYELKPAKPIARSTSYKGPKTDESCICGKRNEKGRVVNGEAALKFEFPWMAAVILKNAPGFERISYCGASILNNRYLLSAAHCFAIENIPPNQIEVVLHAHVLDPMPDLPKNDSRFTKFAWWDLPKETDSSEGSLRLEVEEIINHPLFSSQTFDWDVSILRLKNKLDFSDKRISPLCFPNVGENLGLKPDEILTVSGWGYPFEDANVATRVLQKLDVPYITLDKCRNYMWPANRHHCAGFFEGGKDACQGDSGGPLIKKVTSSNQYMLAGIVSAGSGCARKGSAGLYTNTEEIAQWVYHHTSDATWCSRK